MTSTSTPELPPPYDYCYEWDGPYGTRKFSTARHNGVLCNRSVPLYTAEQMRDYALAAVALHRESEDVAALRRERDALQAKIDALMLEYCPDEMTPEQIANWASHQTPRTIAAALAAQGEQK